MSTCDILVMSNFWLTIKFLDGRTSRFTSLPFFNLMGVDPAWQMHLQFGRGLCRVGGGRRLLFVAVLCPGYAYGHIRMGTDL